MSAAIGEALRDHGIERVAMGKKEWLAAARAAVLQRARERGEVSADDLYDACPPPPGTHPNLVGAVFRRLGLRVLRMAKSRRTAAHARLIPIYGPLDAP